MSEVRDDGVFPKPLAGGSSPRSTNFPEELVGVTIETGGVVVRGGAEYPVRAPVRAALCVELTAVKLWSPRLAKALLAGIMHSPPIPAPVSGSVAVRCAPFAQVACEMRCQAPLRESGCSGGEEAWPVSAPARWEDFPSEEGAD